MTTQIKPRVKMLLDGCYTEVKYDGVKRLHGRAINHPFLGTDDIVTSSIKRVSPSGKVIQTRNTIYILVREQ